MEWRQLHGAAARISPGGGVLWDCDRWRNAGLPETSAHEGGGGQLLDTRLAAPFTADANDALYQWESSRDYNPSPGLERIQAVLLVINSADDERNPPETGIMDRALKRVKNSKLYLIPASEETRGHGTTGMAKFWKQPLQELLETALRRAL